MGIIGLPHPVQFLLIEAGAILRGDLAPSLQLCCLDFVPTRRYSNPRFNYLPDFVETQVEELRVTADCLVTMVTGDSLLTACHVAREVGVIGVEMGKVKRSRKVTSKGKGGKKKRAALLLVLSEDKVNGDFFLFSFGSSSVSMS